MVVRLSGAARSRFWHFWQYTGRVAGERARGRPSLLSEEVAARIVSLVERGASVAAAAQAAGIGVRTLHRWLARGEAGEAGYEALFKEVSRARALARATAEIEVAERDPFTWLRYGPGRSRPGAPGWTELPEPITILWPPANGEQELRLAWQSEEGSPCLFCGAVASSAELVVAAEGGACICRSCLERSLRLLAAASEASSEVAGPLAG
jgi:transposase-like protein